MLEGILAGDLVLPACDTALTEPRHRNTLFEVTGPRALTFAQCIQEMSEALGRPLKFTTVPIDIGRPAVVVTRIVQRRV